MRISLVSGHASDGGPEIAAALHGLGHAVDVTTHPDASITDAPGLGHDLTDRWHDQCPDLVLAQGWLPGLAAQVASREHRIPVVQRFLGLADGMDEPDRSRLEAALARDAWRVLAASGAEVDRLVQMGVRREATRLVPQGVDVTRFTDAGPADLPRLRHRLLAPAGDRATLVALTEVLPTLPDAELVVIGATDLRPVLDAAARLRVADRITPVAGIATDRLPALLRSAHVAIALGDADVTFLLQAMACGVPAVAPDSGTPAETVADGVTGLLVRPGSAEQLGDAVRSLLSDEVRRESLGLAAADRARVRFGWATVAGELDRVLAEAGPDGPAHVAS